MSSWWSFGDGRKTTKKIEDSPGDLHMRNTKQLPENTKDIEPSDIFSFRILKLTFDNFGAGGWIVEVLTELLTSILTYGVFVICNVSFVINDNMPIWVSKVLVRKIQFNIFNYFDQIERSLSGHKNLTFWFTLLYKCIIQSRRRKALRVLLRIQNCCIFLILSPPGTDFKCWSQNATKRKYYIWTNI
jgi:hypothetical protein